VLSADYYFSGNTVILDHGGGLFSLFAHFSKIHVEPGALLRTGDPLGESGATGRVTGPHVHWAVRLNGSSVDPLSLIVALAATVE
jgi:murein DD-endopeptidase MepM/ murein hydrolase activator NlpD